MTNITNLVGDRRRKSSIDQPPGRSALRGGTTCRL